MQTRRLSRTSKLENLLLSDPSRVKIFRKIFDRQSGKPLYKLTKFKVVCVTDHTYVTDNGKLYRKNHICLKPNYRSTVLVAPNTIGDRTQASNSSSRGTVKRPITRSQPVLLEQRPNNPPLSTPMVDLTVDSSSESSFGSNNGRQVAHDSSPIGKRQMFQCYSPPVRFAPQFASTSTPHASTYAAYSRIAHSAKQPEGSFTSPQPQTASSSTAHPTGPPEVGPSRPEVIVSSPEKESTQELGLPSHSVSSELPSSYPLLSLPAQPVADDAESVRSSRRSKKPTQFFGDPLRHSVKSVEEDSILPSQTAIASSLKSVSEEKNMLSNAPVVSTSSPRKPLIRDRLPPRPSAPTSPSIAQRKDFTGSD